MPSAKRRLSQLQRENSKMSKTNMSMFGFLNRKEPPSATTDEITTSGNSVETHSTNQYPDLDQRKKNSGHSNTFNPKWKEGRPWLQCKVEISDDGHPYESMYCSMCTKWAIGNNFGVWVKTGCTSLCLDGLTRHEQSQQHKNAISQELSESVSVDKLAQDMNSQEMKALVDAQKVLHFLIMHNLPHTTLFKPLIELCVELGATNLPNLNKAKNAQYTSPSIVDEFLTCQAEVVEETVLNKVKESAAYGIMVDEYTDVSSRKHLAVVGKYIDNGVSKLSFLQDIQLPNGTASTIYNSLKGYMNSANIPFESMTSFASDGPSVMTGKHNGVVAMLKKDNPKVIPVHCMNHRLQLAVSKAFGNVREIDDIDELLTALWKYYHYSTVKSSSLNAIQDLMKEMGTIDTKQNLTVKKAVHTRWLSHENALQSIRKLYSPICQDLEDAVATGRDKRLGERSGPSASGLLKLMRNYEKLYYILLLCDICACLSKLTHVFEQEHVDISTVHPQIQSTVFNIEKMKRQSGPYLSKVNSMAESLGIEIKNEDKIKTVRAKFITSLLEHMDERLEHAEMVSAVAALDLSRVPTDQATFHGDLELTQLSNHLQLPEDDVLFEWNDIKEKFRPVLPSCTPKFMLEKLHEQKETTGLVNPLMTKLLSVHQTLILSTALVERVFSQVKLIVTEHRNRLNVSTTNKLLLVKLNSKSHRDIDLKCVVKKFLKKNRRLI